MKYYYGNIEKLLYYEGRTATAKQIASIIKRDVDVGKWNKFHKRNKDHPADCRYTNGNFTHHEHMFIDGTEKEFTQLEKLLNGIIEIIPTN